MDDSVMITSASVPEARLIRVQVSNPMGAAVSAADFSVTVAGRAVTGFTIAPAPGGAYVITLRANVRPSEAVVITGRNAVGGTATAYLLAEIKSITFVDTARFIINTDNTTGNVIAADCFDIFVSERAVANFTVSERSKTEYLITLPAGTVLDTGISVRAEGKKNLTGRATAAYTSPFSVSRVTVDDSRNLTIVLAAAPVIELSNSNASAFQVTIGGERLPVTEVVRDMGDRRGTTYRLSVDMRGKQGVLMVNGMA
jgi:hypothetical protein